MATTEGLLAMARLAFKGLWASSITTLALALLTPTLAWAGWGDENWGEMVWGGASIPVPSLSTKALIALAGALVSVSGFLLTRRARRPRP